MLHCQIDRFETWCHLALDLLRQDVVPPSVRWEQVAPQQAFFGLAAATDRSSLPHADDGALRPLWAAAQAGARLPKLLFARAEKAACHRDASKWDLFYRLLWRMTHGESELLKNRSDGDVRRLSALRRAVTLAARQMQADISFYYRLPGAGDYALAWYRPQHAIVRQVATALVQKFLIDKWALLTPDESVEWDGRVLRFGPGVPADAPVRPEQLVALWREYQQHTFRPDRLALGQASAPEFDVPQGGSTVVFVTVGDSAPTGSSAGQPRSAGQKHSVEQILSEALADVGIEQDRVKLIQLADQTAHETSMQNSIAEQNPKPLRAITAARRRRLEAELGRERPRMLVLLGAVAAQTLLGREFRVSRQHGQVFASRWAPWTMATYHPAALEAVPDLTVRARMQEQFLYDLHRVLEELVRAGQEVAVR